MNRRLLLLTALALALLFGVVTMAPADDVRPAYLGVENSKPDRFYITWKNPLFNGAPLPIEPVFPEGFKRITPITVVRTSDAIVRRWVLSSEGQLLEDQTIVIAGLPATTSDVLFRVKFLDDRIFRTVLKPNAPEVTIPHVEIADEPEESQLYSVLRRVDSARLIVLLVAVGLLGALPASRKKGVLFCSVALILGASFGYVVGQVPAGEYFARSVIPSEEKTSGILHGLLLNIYRSFSYGYDEAVYDQMAKSVSGDLLATVYLQARNAMQIDEEEGKAQAFVDRLDIREIDSISAVDGGGFSVIAGWDVYGSVNHWEHIHYRCNAYQARLILIPDGKYWKITGFELLDEKRIL
jgi:hypothetical protein